MKITDLVTEAKHPERVAMIMDAHKELGITHKWINKSNLSDDMVWRTCDMMRQAVSLPDMGKISSPAYPLGTVMDGFKKVDTSAMYHITDGLTKLGGLQGFMHADQLKKLKDAAALVGAMQAEMVSFCATTRNIMQAILEIAVVAKNSTDTYKKSIATATMKKLDIPYEANYG